MVSLYFIITHITITGVKLHMCVTIFITTFQIYLSIMSFYWHVHLIIVVFVVVPVQTYGGTADGAPCVFPFSYKEEDHTECIMADRDRPWCVTNGTGSGNETSWGYCMGE